MMRIKFTYNQTKQRTSSKHVNRYFIDFKVTNGNTFSHKVPNFSRKRVHL